MYICIYLYIYMHIYIYTHIYIYIYINIYTYTYGPISRVHLSLNTTDMSAYASMPYPCVYMYV